MKRIREYHIESYWAEEALRREKRAEFKEKVLEKVILGAVLALFFAVSYGFISQIMGVI
jgi:hypothetical protein